MGSFKVENLKINLMLGLYGIEELGKGRNKMYSSSV